MNTLFSELRRRHVFKVAAAYGVVAWLLIQVAAVTFPAFGAPPWVLRVVIALAALGFPVALVLAWAFELTPEGVRRAEAPAAADSPSSSPLRWRFDNRAAGWVGVGIVVGLTTVGTYGWTRLPDAEAGAEVERARSVAVLPFASVGGSAENEYFSEGVAEEILNALSQVPELRVAARTSAFSFKGQNIGLDSIARALGVGHVLEGSVRTTGDRVRIMARLVDASTGHPLWSHSYDREAGNVLAVQEEIAAAIANALQVTLAGGDASRLTRSRTADPEAYELYLQGRHFASQRTSEGLQQAVQRFEAALERDPAFAGAYSGLADAYALLEDYGGMPREEAFPKSIAAATRALELDELQAEAHASMGHIYYHQKSWAEAERAYLRALALNPNYALASHWYGNLLLATNRPVEAVQALDRAYELDPLSAPIRRARGIVLYYSRQFDRAIAWYHEQLRESPEDADLHNWLARVYLSSGNPHGAIAAMQKVLELSPPDQPDAWARAQLAAAYAAAGQREEAVRILAALEELTPDHGADAHIAAAYGLLGDHDRAIHWLDRAVEQDGWMVAVLRIMPLFDPLRADPRFAGLVKRSEQRSAGAGP